MTFSLYGELKVLFFFYFYLNIIYEGGKICLNKIS